jgi:hypothetical protein
LYILKLITGRGKRVFDLERADKAQISRWRSCLKNELLPKSPLVCWGVLGGFTAQNTPFEI